MKEFLLLNWAFIKFVFLIAFLYLGFALANIIPRYLIGKKIEKAGYLILCVMFYGYLYGFIASVYAYTIVFASTKTFIKVIITILIFTGIANMDKLFQKEIKKQSIKMLHTDNEFVITNSSFVVLSMSWHFLTYYFFIAFLIKYSLSHYLYFDFNEKIFQIIF